MWMFDMLPEGAFEPRPGGGMRLHGGKGGNSAPAPDPRLIEAQIKSLGIQDDVIQRVIGNSERLQPLQEEQLRQGIDATKLAQTQSQEDRTYSLARRNALTGLQDRLTSDAKSFNTEQRSDELAGQAVGDVRQAFGAARTAQMRELTRQGVNPNDGRRAAFDNQFSVAEALGTATAANKTRQMARMEGLALTDRATNALAGYPAQSMQATAAGAGYGAAGLSLANQGVAGVNSGFGQAGAIAGQQGANATGAFNAQANYQANMQQQDQTGSILGGIGGLAVGASKLAPFFAASDRRLKQDIEQIGRDKATGLNLYEFSYINDPDRARYIGVMADEVEPKFPAAVVRDANGVASVNYQMLGIKFKEVA